MGIRELTGALPTLVAEPPVRTMSMPPPTSAQSQGSGGPTEPGDAGPPAASPVFPSGQPEQQVQPEAQQAQTVIPNGDAQPSPPRVTQGMSPLGLQPQPTYIPQQAGPPPVPQLFTPYTPVSNLVRPIPGSVNKSPEDVTREIGWFFDDNSDHPGSGISIPK